MKKILYILPITLFLFSCDPAINCTGTCDGKRIRNIDNGGDYFTIEYDTDNQPIRYEKALNEFATFDYGTTTVTKVYDGKTTTYNLDATGKVISSKTPIDNTSYTYTYDINDQVITTVETKGTFVTTFNHEWVKGNLVKTTYKRPVGDINTTVVYEYDENTKNTVQNPYLELNLLGSVVNNNIQSEYLGLNLTGKSSGNAIKKITKSFVNRAGGANPASIITTYDYVKDGCGCITSSTETVGTNIFRRDYLYELVD
jgi:hypothetical protein